MSLQGAVHVQTEEQVSGQTALTDPGHTSAALNRVRTGGARREPGPAEERANHGAAAPLSS